MPRFYVPQAFAAGETVMLPENVCRHVQVLRLRAGDEVELFDGRGVCARAVLADIGRKQVAATVLAVSAQSRESPLEVVLVQAVSAAERMDFTLQKSTELGVSRIVPVLTERATVRLQGERAEKKVQRWQEIVVAACEQCGRNQVPEVAPLGSLAQAFAALPEEGLRLLMSPHRAGRLADLPPPRRVVLLVGPEGGLSEKEEKLALQHGFQAVLLGPRILRTETASLAALAAMQTLWGDF